jgi:YHS domain-containing protein
MRRLSRYRDDLLLWIVLISGTLTAVNLASILLINIEIPAWVYAVGYSLFSITLVALVAYTAYSRRQTTASLESAITKIQQYEIGLATQRLELRNEGKGLNKFFRVFGGLLKNLHKDEVGRYYLFVEAMDAIADYQLLITKHQCASCIKIFVSDREPNGQRSVKTFCRDTKSKMTRGRHDGREVFRVDNNTAFSTILREGNPYFFSNNLLAEVQYRNEREGFQRFYRSTVIVPILGFLPPDVSDSMHDTQDVGAILGFLCVDSQETNVFDEKATVEFLTSMANILFWPIYYFSSPHQNSSQSTEEPNILKAGVINNE